MGTTSRRGAITKFQEGLNGNTRDALIGCESDLGFNIVSPYSATNKVLRPALKDSRLNLGTNFFINLFYESYTTTGGGLFELYEAPLNIRLAITATQIQAVTTGDVGNFNNTPNFTNRVGRKVMLTYVYDGTGSYIYANGKLLQFVADPNAGQGFDFTGATYYELGNRIANVSSFQGVISNIVLGNTTPTQDEIEFMLSNGGIIPESLHANVIAHYPMTERTGYFDGVDNVFFDVVQQYNYAKSLDQWLQSDGGDPGTFVNYTTAGWSFSTDGNGKITLDVVGSPASPFPKYTLANSGIPINTPITVKVKVTSSVLDSNFFSIQLSKGGEGSALFDVTTSGTYEFEHTFTNVAGPGNLVSVGFQTNANADVGDYVQFEIVEQYIASQRVIDTPNHAKAINFTPDELGITNPSKQTVKKDFYSKGLNVPTALETKSISSFNYFTNIGTIGTGDCTMIMHVYFSGVPNPSWRTFLINGGYEPNWAYCEFVTSSITFYTSTGAPANIQYPYSNPKKILFKVVLSGTTKEIWVKQDGQPWKLGGSNSGYGYDFTGKPSMNLFHATAGSNIHISRQAIANRILTNEEAENLDLVSTGDLLGDLIYDSNSVGFYDRVASTYTALTNTKTSAELLNAHIEKQSLLPEIKQALAVQSSSPQRDIRIDNFTPSNENGYTFIHIIKEIDNIVESGDVFFLNATTQSVGGHIYFQRDSNLRQYGAGLSASQKADVEPYNLDQISVLAVQYNPSLLSEHDFTIRISLNGVEISTFGGGLALDYANSTDSFQIGVNRNGNGNWPNGHWIADLGFKRILSNQEIKSIAQNILSTNTLGYVDWSDALFYYQRNEGSFYDDGSFVRIKNLIGTEEDAYIEGLTGATSADQLADVPNHLVDINSLR